MNSGLLITFVYRNKWVVAVEDSLSKLILNISVKRPTSVNKHTKLVKKNLTFFNKPERNTIISFYDHSWT